VPYYIEQGCDGKPEWWAVKDIAGEQFGCHATKQDAIDQGVAISLADDEPFLGENKPEDCNADGEPIIVCDIDGTLIQGGARVERVWSYVEDAEGALFIVTGRPESERADTESQLADLDIEYSRLIMNDGSTADSAEYKKATVEKLLETYDVVLAVENDAKTLRYYRELGVEAVNPADIPATEQASLPEAGKLARYIPKEDSVSKVETRVSPANFEVREDGDGLHFSGYAAVFDSPSEPLPFIERIAPGAFARSLRSKNDVKLLWNHDTGEVLGSTRAGSMTLTEDQFGLKVDAQLPNTQRGRDTAELLRSGLVDSMSFGFNVPAGGDAWNADGTERTLKSVRLHEVSIVAFPAYSATAGTASVRSLDKVAQRAEVDADALAAALTKIEAGEDISIDDRTLLETVIEKLSPVEIAAEAELGFDADAMLALKKKKLELLAGM